MQIQKAIYEAQPESLSASHQTQIENLENEAHNQYDKRLRYSYLCITAVLGKQHPDMKMDEPVAGVAEYMDNEVAKESSERLELDATEEATSLPRAAPTDVAEASTPRAQLVRPPCSSSGPTSGSSSVY